MTLDVVSFWKMWVFHCSASLPQGEYVSQIDGWWFSIAKSTPSQAINDLLFRQQWTKQSYLGTTMKHRDQIQKWCTNHYWKVVLSLLAIRPSVTGPACSCQVVTKHFSVYGPQILAQCEEARCDWRCCRCWSEMWWTYKLSRWNASDSEDITCFIVWIILIFTAILEYIDYLKMFNNFILMLLGMVHLRILFVFESTQRKLCHPPRPCKDKEAKAFDRFGCFLGVGGVMGLEVNQ